MMATIRNRACAAAVIATATTLCASATAERFPDDSAAVAATSGAATRADDRLKLHFASGHSFTYEDAPSCRESDDLAEARCHRFRLDGYERRWRLFRIAVVFYEGGDTILVDDRTGAETVIDGEMHFSPSGTHIVEILAGADGYDASGPAVQIWRRRGDKFVVEWTGAPDAREGADIQYGLVAWPSPGRIEFRSMVPGDWDRIAKQRTTDVVKHFTLIRRPKGWRLVRW